MQDSTTPNILLAGIRAMEDSVTPNIYALLPVIPITKIVSTKTVAPIPWWYQYVEYLALNEENLLSLDVLCFCCLQLFQFYS